MNIHPRWEEMVRPGFGRMTAISDEDAEYASVIGPGVQLGNSITVHRAGSTEEVEREQLQRLVEKIGRCVRVLPFYIGSCNPVWEVVNQNERSQVFEILISERPLVTLAVALNARPRNS